MDEQLFVFLEELDSDTTISALFAHFSRQASYQPLSLEPVQEL